MKNQDQSNDAFFERLLRCVVRTAVKLVMSLALTVVCDPISGLGLAIAAFA